ncbi:MAG: helix-hairpin-helix domain-containing protein, partial [Halobacteriota archaeon]
EATEPEGDEATEPEGDEATEPEVAEETDAAVAEETAIEEEISESAVPIELTDIKGIGSAYADRLQAAGVEDGADLAAADAADLSAETDISEKRLQRWIDRATER